MTTAPAEPDGQADPVDRRQKIAVASVFVAAMFLNIIDATVVNVALSTIATEFGVDVANTASINIGYLVALAVVMPVAGWLGERVGTRELFAVAVVLFTVASAACGLAPSVEVLVLCRIVQGIAGGCMTPVGMAMLYRTFPPAERVRLSRITTVPIAFAPALGPVVGGLLVQHASWRWIFGINVPVGIAAVVFTLTMVAPLPKGRRNPLDLKGFVLAGLGFAALMFAVSEGANIGWGSVPILGCAAVGVLLLAMLIRVELRSAAPLLALRLFRLRLFRTSSLTTVLTAAAFLGALFTYPLMLQSALGYEPLEAGLLTFPEALGIMAGTQVASRVYARVGPRRLIAGGQLVVMSVLLAIAIVIAHQPPAGVLVALMFLLGLGQSHSFMPTQAAAFDTVPRIELGSATALYNITRQVGSAVGVAVAATVIATVGVGTASLAALAPFQWALVASACLNVMCAALVITSFPDQDAAPSRGVPTPG